MICRNKITSVIVLLAVGAFASAGQLEGFKTDVSKKVIDLSELQSGGPGKDGIASIDSPKFISIKAAGKWIKPQEPIIAVENGSTAKAYPLQTPSSVIYVPMSPLI